MGSERELKLNAFGMPLVRGAAAGEPAPYTAADFRPGNPVRDAYVEWRTKYEDPKAASPSGDFVADMLAVIANAFITAGARRDNGPPPAEDAYIATHVQKFCIRCQRFGEADLRQVGGLMVCPECEQSRLRGRAPEGQRTPEHE